MGDLMKFLVLAITLTIHLTPHCDCFYEDQVGTFDWHQKYFGHVNYILTDLKQPKRIIVGASNNVVGGINSNNGAILYREVLESTGELKYLGNYGENLILAVASFPDNIVKVRTFEASNGILVDERAFTASITHAGESNSNVYLIDVKKSEVSISKVNFEDDDKDGIRSSRTVKLDAQGEPTCAVSGEYLACSNNKNAITVINLDNGSTSRKVLDDSLENAEISTSGSGEIPAVLLAAKSGPLIFHILKNDKNGPELLPIPYSAPSGVVRLSQGTLEEAPVLFISSIRSPGEILVEVYNKNLEKIPSQELRVHSSIPVTSLRVAKGFCSGSRCGLVGFTREELLFGTKIDSKTAQKPEVNVDWTRHEALGSVLAAEVIDYPSEIGPSWNPYQSQQDLLTAFVSRVKYEVESLVLGESLYSSSMDRFGLRKIIVLVTSVGQVVGMDSSSGSILYSFVLPDFELLGGSNVLLYIQRPAKFAPLKPQATVLYGSASAKSATTILYPFNPVDGKPLDQPQTYPPILQAQILLHGTEETKFLKPLLLMDNSLVIHSYPANVQKISNSYFFIAKKNPPLLQGYGIRPIAGSTKLQGKLLWELNLGDGEILGVHGKLLGERVHSQGRVLPDRSVSYKYMNPNLVAVVTAETEAGNINVFLVDAVSGNVVHSFWHKKSRGPVHVVHSEHWLVYSLYSEKSRRFEVNSVELYEGQSQSNKTAFSSFSSVLQPIIVKQSYVFPTGIQYMAHTRTEKGITNKDVLVALPSGGVLELPRMILQPRLSQQHYVQQIQDEDGVILSMPYIPELPLPDEMIINYNQSVKRVTGIKTYPTRLESTCLVLVHGLDLFYTRVTPSKTFDVLKDDFDHWFITVVLAALVAGAYVTKRLAARKQLEQAWR